MQLEGRREGSHEGKVREEEEPPLLPLPPSSPPFLSYGRRKKLELFINRDPPALPSPNRLPTSPLGVLVLYNECGSSLPSLLPFLLPSCSDGWFGTRRWPRPTN